MLATSAIATFDELCFLIDQALAALHRGRRDVADVYGCAAQRLLEIAMPDIANDVALIASRKGVGGKVAQRIVPGLTPATAAAVATVWTLRGARAPAIDALSAAFGNDPAFLATIKVLCRRVFERTPVTPPTPSSPTSSTASFEAFAPPGR